MPLWKIYCPVDTLSDGEKRTIAQGLTDLYGRIMPRFYVGVVFSEVAARDFYIGGEPNGHFLRIWVDHIARTFKGQEQRDNFFRAVSAIFAPHIEKHGLGWELHVDETPFDLWTIQGFRPPAEGTEDERRWTSENRASPRTHA